jgi:hypothetical protein
MLNSLLFFLFSNLFELKKKIVVRNNANKNQKYDKYHEEKIDTVYTQIKMDVLIRKPSKAFS